MTFDLMLGVPIDSSGAFVGCERLPAALRAAGLVEALGIPDLGNLQVTIADPVRDPEHGVLGLRDAANACQVVRRELAPLLADGRRPLVLGGCCTLLIGVMAALRDNGTDAGLLFVDGHLDCYDGASSPYGEAADMELAILLGVGAPALTEIAGTLSDRRVVALGNADEEEAAGNRSPDPRTFAPAMPIVDFAELARDPGGPRAPRARAPPRRRRLLAAPRPRRPLQGRAARGRLRRRPASPGTSCSRCCARCSRIRRCSAPT